MYGFSFEYGFAFGALGIFLLCQLVCPMRVKALYFANMHIFKSVSTFQSPLLTLLKWGALISFVIALASPYKSRHIDVTPKEGYDIAVVLDASLSMRERGFSKQDRMLNRFDVVKNIVSDFIKTRKNDNLGLVVFGEFAFIAAPLTYDKVILSDIVKRFEIGMAGKSTAIYDALGQGVKLLKNSSAKSKIAILLTDGKNTTLNVGLDEVLKLAKKYEIKVYTIGIGYDREFNEMLLNKIASDTGGAMFKAHSGEELQSIYKEIDRLEKSEIKSQTFENRTYYYHYPLGLSLALLFLYLIFRYARGIR